MSHFTNGDLPTSPFLTSSFARSPIERRDHLFSLPGNIPVSRRRLLTAFRVVVALTLTAVPVVRPDWFPWLTQSNATLGAIYAVLCAGTHHFKGGATKAASTLLTSGIIGPVLGFLLSLLASGNHWIGLALFVVVAFLIPGLNSLWDPTYKNMTVIKITLLDILFLVLFPAPPDETKAPEALQLMFIHALSFVVLSFTSLFASATVVNIVAESEVLLTNCAYFLDETIKTMRLPKPVADKSLRRKISSSMDDIFSAAKNSGSKLEKSNDTRDTSPTGSIVELSDGEPEATSPDAFAELRTKGAFPEEDERVDSPEEELNLLGGPQKLEAEHQYEEKLLASYETTISTQIHSLHILYLEALEDTWLDASVLESVSEFVETMKRLYAHIVGMRQALAGGFLGRINFKLIKPLSSHIAELRIALQDFMMSLGKDLLAILQGSFQPNLGLEKGEDFTAPNRFSEELGDNMNIIIDTTPEVQKRKQAAKRKGKAAKRSAKKSGAAKAKAAQDPPVQKKLPASAEDCRTALENLQRLSALILRRFDKTIKGTPPGSHRGECSPLTPKNAVDMEVTGTLKLRARLPLAFGALLHLRLTTYGIQHVEYDVNQLGTTMIQHQQWKIVPSTLRGLVKPFIDFLEGARTATLWVKARCCAGAGNEKAPTPIPLEFQEKPPVKQPDPDSTHAQQVSDDELNDEFHISEDKKPDAPPAEAFSPSVPRQTSSSSPATRSSSTQGPFAAAMRSWVAQGSWRFPLRFALFGGLLSGLALLLSELVHFDMRWAWGPVTLMIVMMPGLGSSIKRGVHRVGGTLLGATSGAACRYVVAVTPIGWEEQTLLLVLMAVFAFIFAYHQHSRKYARPYSWTVASFTFVLIICAGFPYTVDSTFGWQLAGFRALHVAVGSLVSVVVSFVFPIRATDALLIRLANTLRLISLGLPEVFVAPTDPVPWRFHICDALENIFSDLPKQKDLLKDAKAELILSRRRRQMLIEFYQHILPVASSLVSMNITLKRGFSERLHELIDPFLVELAQVQPLVETDIEDLLHFLGHNDTILPLRTRQQHMSQLIRAIQHLDKAHFQMRHNCAQEKLFHIYNHELVRFNAYYYTVRELVLALVRLMQVVQFYSASNPPPGLSQSLTATDAVEHAGNHI